jgi:hypothetical protein
MRVPLRRRASIASQAARARRPRFWRGRCR